MPADERAGSDGSVPSNAPTVAGEALRNFGFPTLGAPQSIAGAQAPVPGGFAPASSAGSQGPPSPPQRKRRRGLLLASSLWLPS
jgi:hypothetical protein